MAFWSSLWRWLRFPIAILATLVILMLGGVAWLLSGQRYQTFLTEQLSTLLQAQVSVAHSQLSLFRGFGIALQGVEVRHEATSEAALTTERMVVFLEVRALFHGQLLFSHVECVKPTIHLTEHTRGLLGVFGELLRSSENAVPSQSNSLGWLAPSLALRDLIISEGEISYRRNERAAPFSVTQANLRLAYAPGDGVTTQIEAALGEAGELGFVAIRARAPSWDTQGDLQQAEWVGNVHLDRLRLRDIGRSFGGEWPEATLTLDGEARGKGNRPRDLNGTARVSDARFGRVQVQSGTINVKKFQWGENLEPGKPITWTTLLQTLVADFELEEVHGALKDQTLPVVLHAGSVTMRDGDLTIVGGRGDVGAKSRLLDMHGTLKQLASPKGPVPDLTLKAELDFREDLHDLFATLTKFGLPDLTQQTQNPQGTAMIDLAVQASRGARAVTYDGSVQFREAAFSVPFLKQNIRGLTGTVTFSDDVLLLDTVALSIGASTVQVSGRVDKYHQTARRKADLQLSADLDLSDLDTIVTDVGKFWPLPVDGDGTELSQSVNNPQGRMAVRLAVRTAGAAGTALYEGGLTFQQAAFQIPRWNISVADLSGTLQIGKDSLSTPGVTFMVGGASLRAQGSLRDYLTPQRTGEVRLLFTEVPDVEVSAMLSPTLIHPQGGTLGGLVDLIFVGNGDLRTRGEVTLTRMQVDPLPKVLRAFTVEEGELLWEGQSGTFVITRGSATGSPFHGQGRIRSFAPLNIEAALDFPVFTVESIFHLEEQPPAPEPSPKNKTVIVQVDVTAEQLTYKAFRADRVRASCYWHDRQADIHVAEANIAGGQVQGDAVVWPDFNALFVAPQLTAVQVPQLLTALGASSDVLTGVLSGGGQIYIPDRHLWKSPAHWQAQLSLGVENGVAQRVPILVRLWSAVSLQSVLKLQLPGLPNEGLAFSSLNGDFAVGSGVAVTRNLSLQSSAVRLNADGEINLADRTVDLKTTFSPLYGITSSVAKVPLAGQVLAQGAELLTTLPFRVSGPYHDPTVIPWVVDLGRR